jgi:hypothetical protein
MSTSKKDYEAIAAILLKARTPDDDISLRLTYDIAIQIAGYFREQNKAFDEDRFLKACGF